MSPEELIAEHVAPVADLARELRTLVRAAMADAEERVYPGWHGLGYIHPEAGYVCGIFPRGDHVRLGFEHGHLLPDPDGLLTAAGSQVRYVVVQPGTTLPATGIRDLIADAVELRAGR